MFDMLGGDDDDEHIYWVRPCGDADSGVSHPCHTIPSSDVIGMVSLEI
jgi:hypothetical protein